MPRSMGATLHSCTDQRRQRGSFFQASELILHEFRKMSGEFVEIGLVKVTFPVQEIYTVKLCKK